MPISSAGIALAPFTRQVASSQLRPVNPYVGALGHSMLDQGNGNFGSAPNIDVQMGAGAFPFWASVLSRGQFVMDRQSWLGAISGTNTQQMINGGQLAAAGASRAGNILLWLTTNDRPAGFTLDDGSEVTAIGSAGTSTLPNVRFILRYLTGLGKTLTLLTDPPRGTATGTAQRLTGAQLTNHVGCRNYFLQRVPQLFPGQVAVVDTWPDGANNVTGAEGDVRDLFTRDNLHPAARYSFLLARRVLTALQGFGVATRSVPVLSKPDTYDATVNPRGALNTVRMGGLNSAAGSTPAAQGGVTYSGTRPSGYGPAANTPAQAGTLTVALTRNQTSPQTGETDWFELAVSGTTAANANPLLQVTRALSPGELANIAAGDKLTCFGEFQVDSGGVGLNGVAMTLQRVAPGIIEQFDLGFADDTSGVWDAILAAQPIAGFHDGEGQAVTFSGTETLTQMIWTIRLLPSASPNFKVRLRNDALRKVF